MTVDDSRTIHEMVAFTLKGAGYEVIEAHDGQHVLDVLAGGRVEAGGCCDRRSRLPPDYCRGKSQW